ncbi:serine/arginine repetitive matrix protein 1-like [Macrobrachium nipponense]|uniref:serine/arginine repetitive matrix protein 1-like n=1 Tax=Macrobrachium nipponense TaxID=159736 RepID=UPI0030C814D6
MGDKRMVHRGTGMEGGHPQKSPFEKSIRNLESKVLALEGKSESAKCSDSAPCVVEGASDRPHFASRPVPLQDFQVSGRGHVESRRRVMGNPHRSDVPLAVSVDATQTAKERAHARLLKECFSSSEASSPRKGWSSQSDSRPLKRSVCERDASRPGISPDRRSSPDSAFAAFPPQKRSRASSEDDSFERPSHSRVRSVAVPVRRKKASPRPSPSHRISPSPVRESSPTEKILCSLQQQLACVISQRKTQPRHRRKDDRLPVKRSRQSPSLSPRSSLSPVSSPSRVREAPQRLSRGREDVVSRSSRKRSGLRLGPEGLVPSLVPPTSPVSEDEVSGASEEADDDQPLAPVSSDYQVLTRLLQSSFGDTFQPAAPRSPPSQLLSSKVNKASGFVRMKKSLSTKRAFRKVHDWMERRKAQGKTSFALPPSRLSGKAGMWYETGEDVGLRLPSSAQGDFASLVDASRRSLLASSKVTWSTTEMDYHLKGLFRLLEVFNFLDWCLGVLDTKSRSPDSISLGELSSVMSCIDKAVRDGSEELAAHFCTGLLKKRSHFATSL